MKKTILLAICFTGLQLSSFAGTANSLYQPSYVSAYGLNSNSYSKGYGSGNRNNYSYGSTHNVRPYTKKDGTYVEGHRAGNPNSGVHCRNNACY